MSDFSENADVQTEREFPNFDFAIREAYYLRYDSPPQIATQSVDWVAFVDDVKAIARNHQLPLEYGSHGDLIIQRLLYLWRADRLRPQ